MAGDHGTSEAGLLPKAIAEAIAQKIRSWALPRNEGVPGWLGRRRCMKGFPFCQLQR